MTIFSSESESADLITRREAVRRVTALLGGAALVGGSALLTGCREDSSGKPGPDVVFSPDDVAFLDEVAETILPETKTPGAKAAKVGAFMALMVTDSYSADDQKVFRDGMRALDDASRKANGASFMTATPQQRLALLQSLDQEQKTHSDAREPARREAARIGGVAPPAHYFRMMKELSLLGYFTSEIGCTKALRYVESPGRFDPCLPYTAGEPAQASHA